MSLLDYQPDPLAQGLLGAGMALLTPRSRGGGVAGAFGAFNQGLLQAQALRRQMEQDALRERVYNAQIKNYESEAEQRRATAAAKQRDLDLAAQRERAQREVLTGIVGRGQPGFRDASIAMTGNAPAGYTPPTSRARITDADMAAWIANGGDPKQLQAIAEAGNLGRPKVAGTVRTTDAQGRPVNRMRDEFGEFIGDALPEPYEKKFQDTGGSIGVLDPFTAALSGSIGKTMTPGEVASNSLGWANNRATLRGQDLTDARAREAAGAGRVPPGYRFKPDGTLEAIPGGPADPAVKDKGDEWQTFEGRGIQVNKRTGESRSITLDGRPIGVKNDDVVKREQNAKDALKIIEQAEGLLDKSTSGYFGTGVDKAVQVLGMAPAGAIAGGQLKTLQGALMMRMPRMEGPQSNLDVQLYRESVGQIGDTTVPVAVRKAALAEVRRLQEKYAGIEPSNTVDFKTLGRVPRGGLTGGVIDFGDLK